MVWGLGAARLEVPPPGGKQPKKTMWTQRESAFKSGFWGNELSEDEKAVRKEIEDLLRKREYGKALAKAVDAAERGLELGSDLLGKLKRLAREAVKWLKIEAAILGVRASLMEGRLDGIESAMFQLQKVEEEVDIPKVLVGIGKSLDMLETVVRDLGTEEWGA